MSQVDAPMPWAALRAAAPRQFSLQVPGVQVQCVPRAIELLRFTGPRAAQAARAAGAALPDVNRVHDGVAWRAPDGWFLFAEDAAGTAALAARLAPQLAPGTVQWVPQSDALRCYALRGERVEALLCRLVDALSLPRAAGHCARARFIDVPVFLVRSESGFEAWFETSLSDYAEHWLNHAAQAMC